MAQWLVVGLGNPGDAYAKTRHNVGFMALDVAREDQDVVLAKPQTYMNNSGAAVKSFVSRFKLHASKLIVVHDDIDLPLGKVKISMGAGSAGHKGVQSIINALGTQDFTRVRVGIQPEAGKPANVEKFVLQKFSKKEEPVLKQALEAARTALETIASRGLESAMQNFN